MDAFLKGITVSLKLMLFTLLFTAAGIILYVFCAAFHPSVTPQSLLNASSDNVEEQIIVIDPGHGGEDGGAVGVNGALEKELNLAIAENVAHMLKYSGFHVILTREEDIMLTDGKPGKKKQADLRERLRIAQQSEQNILVSIHMNKFPDQRVHGLQVYYSKNQPFSEELAKTVQQTVTDTIENDNRRPVKEATSSIYILHNAKIPAILIECGFLSNQGDLARLQDENYQKQLSCAISAALINCLTAK
ncbi:MAG: N-acetylmuramoyl-L-alanine amidase [Clostridiales bacterium]|nr:N-acetylmuramoyl-L-alanine amidase [Clostridiales bacterium]